MTLDYDIPSVVPAGLIHYAVGRGVPAHELFTALGITPAALQDPEQPVRAEVMMPLWRFLAARFQGEAFTLDMASRMDFSYLGLPGQLIRHSPTLQAALERTLRYQRLYDPALATSLERSGDHAAWCISHVEAVRRIGVSLEFMAAVTVHYLRALTGEHVQVVSVALEGEASGDPLVYTRYFGGPVRFSSAAHGDHGGRHVAPASRGGR